MSLDGFVAGRNQSLQEPLGIGGERLHEWVFPLEIWRRAHGKEGGAVNESTPVMEAELANVGATIMGRKMFGGGPGPWSETEPWNGWWGRTPPFGHPVFVLTHHAREPLVLDGGTTFTFVTDGIERALEQARRAAGGKDVGRCAGRAAVPDRRPGRRDAAAPGADAARRGRAPVRGRGGAARPRAGRDRRGAGRRSSQIRQRLGVPRR